MRSQEPLEYRCHYRAADARHHRHATRPSQATRLFRLRFQFGVEEFHDAGLAAEAEERFADHVGAEQGEEVKWFSGVEKGLGKLHGMLRVNVVVRQAVDEQDGPAQF